MLKLSTDYFWFGFVSAAVGLDGTVRLKVDVDDITRYRRLRQLFLEHKGELTKYTIERLRLPSASEALVLFKGVDSRDAADRLKGQQCYLPVAELPALTGNKFYYHEVIDFMVEDEAGTPLGPVLRINELPAQDALVFSYLGHEVWVPLLDEFILEVDRDKRVIRFRLPDGLLDVYTLQGEEADDMDTE